MNNYPFDWARIPLGLGRIQSPQHVRGVIINTRPQLILDNTWVVKDDQPTFTIAEIPTLLITVYSLTINFPHIGPNTNVP